MQYEVMNTTLNISVGIECHFQDQGMYQEKSKQSNDWARYIAKQ